MTTNGTLKRTRSSPSLDAKIQALSSILTARIAMASGLGFSHEGKRDVFKTLGYPQEVKSEDLIAQWKRQDIARAIVDRPVKATWQGDVRINEPGDEKDTPLEKAFKELDERLGLRNKLMRVDRLSCLGRYAILLLGFDDSAKETWPTPVTPGKRDLLYVRPISQANAEVSTWEADPSSPRYGKPRLYSLTLKKPGGSNEQVIELTVHWSRVIHVAQDVLEDDVEGYPVMEALFNRLKDLEKLVGGSAEMFWRGARPGYAGSAKEDYKIDPDVKEKFQKQIEEYENDLRRVLISEGIELKSLAQQISDPKGNVDVQMMMISAVSGIPLRILTGSERGELASSSDQENWRELIQARREESAEPLIMRPFIDTLLLYQILPPPVSEDLGYSVHWPDLTTINDKDRSEIGARMAGALAAYAREPMLEQLIPLEAFLTFFLGLDEDTVTAILEIQASTMNEWVEEEDSAEPVEPQVTLP